MLADHRVEPALREVWLGDSVQRISPKALDVLSALVDAGGQVVTRQDLIDRVWSEVTVGEEVLTQAITELRRVFHDSAKAPRVIGTIPKTGYRLLVPVQRPDHPPADNDPKPLSTALPVEERHPTETFVLGREHKQVTVLDCGLTDAADLAAVTDAEAMAETVDTLQKLASETVARYEGTVAQWLGDGFVALFGAPRAVEDHPRRAIGAALDLVADFARIVQQTRGSTAASARLSIGVHTGPAVVGLREAKSLEVFTAVGTTTETAKKLKGMAPRSTVLASAATCEILSSEVIKSPFPPGSTVTDIYQVQDFHFRRSGVPRRARPTLSRFVGRSGELQILLSRIGGLAASAGQSIDIVGEPGIGKSRLVDEVETQLSGSDIRFLRAHCLPHGRDSPYLPLTALLRDLCAVLGSDDEADLEPALTGHLARVGLKQPETLSLLLQLLGLQHKAEILEPLTPEEKQERIFDGLHRLVSLAAEVQPVVMLVEDLHWIDATSQAWLAEEADQLAGRALLLLTTRRPGKAVPWQGLSSATQIALPNLPPTDSRALVRSVPRLPALRDEDLDMIVGRAQGNPFFLEELAVAHSAAPSGEHLVPETVQAVIAARIDRLPPTDKRILTLAAVIGARIPLDLLARVDGLSTADRLEGLRRLQRAELLYERRRAPETVFAFKHALTQEVAYQGLVARTRRQLHHEIAETLERDFPALVDARPEILARHLSEAGENRAAVEYWRAAGRKAAAQASGVEAVSHYQAALALIDATPDENLTGLKLDILVDLGAVLQAVRGAGSEDVGQVYRRARDLSRSAVDPVKGFVALWGLWRYRVLNGEFQQSSDLADELVELARPGSDTEMRLQAHHAVWTTARFSGSLAQAIEHTEIGLALAEPRFHTAPHYPYGGHDPICCAFGTRAIVLELLGRHDSARRDITHALELAHGLNHRPSVAGVYLNAADLYLAGRDRRALADAALTLRDLGKDLGFAMHENIGEFSLGWCGYQDARGQDSLERMREALARSRNAGGTGREPYHYALFADCLAHSGRVDEALLAIEEAFDVIERKRSQHWAKSEAHRIMGEVLWRSATVPDETAERHLDRAVSVSNEQGALTLELRAACALAEFWSHRDKDASGSNLIQAVLDRFKEDADHPDIRAAKSQLAESSDR